MATTYTDHFLFPLLGDGSENWGSIYNGAMEIMDREIYAAQHPIMLISTGEVVVSRLQGEILLKHYDNGA